MDRIQERIRFFDTKQEQIEYFAHDCKTNVYSLNAKDSNYLSLQTI